MEIIEGNINRFLESEEFVDTQSVCRYILDNISYQLDNKAENIPIDDLSGIRRYLYEKVKYGLAEQEKKLGSKKRMDHFIRVAILSAIDEAWVEQVDFMQQLQYAVSGRATAQRNVLHEYLNEAFESYEKMQITVYKNAMRNMLLSDVFYDKEQKIHILFP